MRDDFETNVKFIEIVQLNPCIYDQTRSDYSNRNKQDKVWGEIAKQLNEPVATCRERWKNIRGRYVKQINKPPPSGSAAKSKKPYYLSEYLHFLDTFIRSRTPTGNVQSQSVETDKERESEVTEEQSNSIPDISDADEESFTRDETLEANRIPGLSDYSNPSTPETSVPIQSNFYRRKNKQATSLSEVNRSAIKYFDERKKRQNSAPAVLDPDEAFLKSVLPDMKNMTEAQKRNFKVAVLRVAGEILNQPVVTPPSILPHYSVIQQSTDCLASNSNRSLPVISASSSSERLEQDRTNDWNESIFLPQYSVVSQATSVDSNVPESNQTIEELGTFCDL
ncbi:transcription factor Adf-1-like [Ostrinia furnacalis]|uniref:transcription factor Adf-1-like n=1 Tax=Ostrinia furnacalis TaxID=93504 RepID=UPI00103AAD75|nr:transcription factor Adf-1-like [Ostrinia furnacalis]